MQHSFLFVAATATAFASLACSSAFAHVTLEVPQAAIGGYYKAVIRVPHGCAGSPTVKVKVRIPEGVISIKPKPKSGWTLDTVKGQYARSYSLHGGQISAGVQQITWSGKLLDEHFDEFEFQAYLAPSLSSGTTLYFPVVQECEQGVARWIDASGSNQSPEPAPGLRLLPKP